MLFTSYKFFIFVPICVLIYFLVPKKARPATLLAESYVFYWGFGIAHMIPLLCLTLTTFYIGILIERSEDEVKKKRLVTAGVLFAVLFLGLFKYLGFIVGNVNLLLGLAMAEPVSLPFSLIQPVGISYLILQVISYLVDIKRGIIPAEHNLVHYGLYLAFFPKIISGPIEKGKRFLTQVKESADAVLWDPVRVRDGAIRVIWGYFLKIVISDRMSIFVENVLGNYKDHGRYILILGLCGYFVQLTADFVGCMDIALGIAKIFGYELTENFRGPTFSKSIRESWNRWHITLGEWLRDYVYIPLGGSRRGSAIRTRNVIIVFAVSGLWHGAAWHYVAWGVLNGIYEFLEELAAGHKFADSRPANAFRMVRTLFLWLIALVFFRMNTVGDAFIFIKRVLTVNDMAAILDRSVFSLGIPAKYALFMIIVILIMGVVEYIRYSRNMADIAPLVGRMPIIPRYALLIALIMTIIVFGAYGPAYNASNFIYFGF